MKIMFVKVRAALQAANGELDAQHQCSVCHIFASTRDALQVSASHLFLILTKCNRPTSMVRLTRRRSPR